MKIPVTTLPTTESKITAEALGKEGAGSEGAAEPDLSTVCQACGLCCAGVLFTDVALSASEAQSLQDKKPENPVVVVTHPRAEAQGAADDIGGGDATQTVEYGMDQPCQFLCGTSCGIYADRPHKCRAFECTLLDKVQKHQLTVDHALQVVSVAKNYVANIEASLPDWLPEGGGSSVFGLRAKLYVLKKALTTRHIQFTRDNAQTSLAADHQLTYQVLNYLRFMAEYFHKSSLLLAFEKLLRAQTFTAPPPQHAAQREPHADRGE